MNESIRKSLADYIVATKLSQNSVATALGVSASAISQYLKNKYPGDLGALETKVAQFLQLSTERAEYPQARFGYIATSVADQVGETARNCRVGSRIGVITGESGLGKTTAIKHYASNNADVIVIYTRPHQKAKAMLKELAAKAGVSNLHGDKDTLFLRIVDRLDQSGRMIVVDEAENLDAGATDYLRRLNDAEFAGIGILLVGLPRLLQNLRSSQGDYKYIYSRVGRCVPVSNLTDADCKAFVEQPLPNDIELWRVFADSSRRNARVLRNLIERSIEIANFNQVAIDASLVRQVRAKLLFN